MEERMNKLESLATILENKYLFCYTVNILAIYYLYKN